MLEKAHIIAQGRVEIYSIKEGISTLVHKQKNAIQPNYVNILAASLSGLQNARLDDLRILNGVTPLATSNQVTITYLPTDTTSHQFIVPANAFSGSYDTLELSSQAHGIFSILNLPSPLTKAPNEQLAIIWLIQFF